MVCVCVCPGVVCMKSLQFGLQLCLSGHGIAWYGSVCVGVMWRCCGRASCTGCCVVCVWIEVKFVGMLCIVVFPLTSVVEYVPVLVCCIPGASSALWLSVSELVSESVADSYICIVILRSFCNLLLVSFVLFGCPFPNSLCLYSSLSVLPGSYVSASDVGCSCSCVFLKLIHCKCADCWFATSVSSVLCLLVSILSVV